jgi:uncharacterized membrane protein YgdD (TMEM256/DUF423 family)
MVPPARLLFIASLFGLVAILLGTLAEHAFRARVDAESFRYLMTAVRYLQVHSAVLLGLALALLTAPSAPALLRIGLHRSFWILLAGTALFAGSIFAAVATGLAALTALTPVGGTAMMLGWLSLAWTARRAAPDRRS